MTGDIKLLVSGFRQASSNSRGSLNWAITEKRARPGPGGSESKEQVQEQGQAQRAGEQNDLAAKSQEQGNLQAWEVRDSIKG